ncbi:MAG: polyprenol monophosphomannose synthase [Vicinamibacterales bacterium]
MTADLGSPAPSLAPGSPSTPSLSIVIPTFNERGRLTEMVEAVVAVWRRHGIAGELIIVDDNSPDGTGALADELSTRFPLRVVHRRGKLGLGTAVVAGFDAARAPILGVMDADLSHPPDLLPAMLDVMRRGDVDFVIGSRYVPGGGCRNWSFGRLAMSRLACLLARPVTPVRDATSGFFLVKRDATRNVTIAAGGFKICLELLVRGWAQSVAEVPYTFVGRTVGESKMNLKEAAGYLEQLYELWRYRHLGDGRGRRQRYVHVER